MGEIADMMIDGILCEECGEYIGDAVGYPRLCSGCSHGVINEDDRDFDTKDDLIAEGYEGEI